MPAPKTRRLFIDGIDHKSAATDEFGRRHASLERMFEKARADTLAGPLKIGRELS